VLRVEVREGHLHLGQRQTAVGQLKLMAVYVDQGGIQAMPRPRSCHVGVGGAAVLPHKDLDGHPLAGPQESRLVLLDLLAFGLVATVLEPYLHLRLRQP